MIETSVKNPIHVKHHRVDSPTGNLVTLSEITRLSERLGDDAATTGKRLKIASNNPNIAEELVGFLRRRVGRSHNTSSTQPTNPNEAFVGWFGERKHQEAKRLMRRHITTNVF